MRASEDSAITGTVAANDSDVDDGAVLTYSLDAPVAGLTLNADGSYSFDAGNAAYQHLAQGATQDVVANYTVTDEHGATGDLDADHHADRHQRRAGGGGRRPMRASEDSTITGTVATNDSDVDDGAILTYSLDAPVAGLTLNADGSYSFDAGNAAYQHLAQGATQDVVANYTVTDEHGATGDLDADDHRDRHQRRAGGGGRHQCGQRGQPPSPARSRPTTATSMTARS